MNPQKSPSFPPNSSPVIPWGSPALRPNSSFPPMNNHTPPLNSNTPPHRPPMQMGMTRPFGSGTMSPQFGMPFNRCSFRTPQPQHRQQSPLGPWSDNRGHKGTRHHQGNGGYGDSPRNSPSVNPGGSDNILNYYNPAMLKDPWLHTPPQPVDFWKS